jgi:hypothetical protein
MVAIEASSGVSDWAKSACVGGRHSMRIICGAGFGVVGNNELK